MYKFYREKEVSPIHEVSSNDTQAFWYMEEAGVEQGGQYYCTASNRANLLPNIPKSNILTVKGEARLGSATSESSPRVGENKWGLVPIPEG